MREDGKKKLKSVNSPYEKKLTPKQQKERQQPLRRKIFRDMDVLVENRSDEFLDLMQQRNSSNGDDMENSQENQLQRSRENDVIQDQISLINIIQHHKEAALAEMMRSQSDQENPDSHSSPQTTASTSSSGFTKKYEVMLPSQTEEGKTEKKIVQIKILDILFDDQVCYLVYMQDLTKFVEDGKKEKQTEDLLKASHFISSNIQVPQQTIIMLAQNMIDGLKDSQQRETLQAI